MTCLSIYMLEVYYRHLPIYSGYRAFAAVDSKAKPAEIAVPPEGDPLEDPATDEGQGGADQSDADQGNAAADSPEVDGSDAKKPAAKKPPAAKPVRKKATSKKSDGDDATTSDGSSS